MGLIDFEIGAWVALSAISSAVAWLELRDSRDDFAYLLAHKINGRRKAVARIHVRTATTRFGASLSFLAIGISSWLANLGISTALTVALGIVFPVLMFVVLIWSLLVMATDRHERARLVRSLFEDHG